MKCMVCVSVLCFAIDVDHLMIMAFPPLHEYEATISMFHLTLYSFLSFKEGGNLYHNGRDEKERQRYEESLSRMTLSCKQLEKAKNNPNAKAFFAREPDESNGFDRMWVSAIDNACVNNLVGVFRDYGVQFALNFGEWNDQSPADAYRSIEDVAAYKARKVYEVTGLPCIAVATSFEVDAIKQSKPSGPAGPGAGNRNQFAGLSSRVSTGYKFNKIGDHVDQLVDALIPASDASRLTTFKSVLCFYDGGGGDADGDDEDETETQLFDYGECDVDLALSSSVRAFVPISSAIKEMCETLQLAYNLEYQTWLKKKVRAALGNIGGASLKLRDRVLKEANVLPNEIIDVSSFMDSKIDVNLMEECGDELSKRFIDMKPTKILTVATTGLIIALPMAKFLQVPVVYARKERSVVMASTYQAPYSSKTVGKNRELIVSKKHIDPEDRILIVDDFLSSGSSQEALLRIVADAGATAVGVGVLIEKTYDSGRQYLSGFNVKVESMIRVASVKNEMIQIMEEDGFDDI
jgi:xanthine phosphoribosyltransferase